MIKVDNYSRYTKQGRASSHAASVVTLHKVASSRVRLYILCMSLQTRRRRAETCFRLPGYCLFPVRGREFQSLLCVMPGLSGGLCFRRSINLKHDKTAVVYTINKCVEEGSACQVMLFLANFSCRGRSYVYFMALVS